MEIYIITQFEIPLIKTFNEGQLYTNSNQAYNEYIEHVFYILKFM